MRGVQILDLLVEWWVLDVTGMRWLKICCNNENRERLFVRGTKNIMATLTFFMGHVTHFLWVMLPRVA